MREPRKKDRSSEHEGSHWHRVRHRVVRAPTGLGRGPPPTPRRPAWTAPCTRPGPSPPLASPAKCQARRGVVYDAAAARRLRYGELVDAASALPVPAPDSVLLKQPKDFTLIGTPAKRLDSPDKVNGKAQFGIDVKVPGMKFAAIAISPAFGGKLRSVNEAAALAVRGVHQVVRIDNAVAVVADHTWVAKKGLKA